MRFIQVAVPSRTHVPAYQQVDREVDEVVRDINDRWRTEVWEPIVYIKQQQGSVEMMALHLLSRFCIVSSLHDGMNLVAKEFVASRHDGDGVLILSRFTGSARELSDAIQVNPFSIGEIAEAVHCASAMPEDERRRRMQRMRAQVKEYNVYRWAGKILSSLLKFDFPEGFGRRMTTLNLTESLPEIASRIDRAESILLGLDFDGTLTPIRPRPEEVVLPEPVRAVLARLAGLPRVTLMIVSGRSLGDVASRVGLPQLIYAGNHGLEIRGPGLVFVEPTAALLVDSPAGTYETTGRAARGDTGRSGGIEGPDHERPLPQRPS